MTTKEHIVHKANQEIQDSKQFHNQMYVMGLFSGAMLCGVLSIGEHRILSDQMHAIISGRQLMFSLEVLETK